MHASLLLLLHETLESNREPPTGTGSVEPSEPTCSTEPSEPGEPWPPISPGPTLPPYHLKPYNSTLPWAHHTTLTETGFF